MIYHYDGLFKHFVWYFCLVIFLIFDLLSRYVSLTALGSQCWHFHSVISPPLSVRRNLQIFKVLRRTAPQVFTRQVIYDGKKNLFATYELPLGDTGSEKVRLPQINCDIHLLMNYLKFILYLEDVKPTKSDRPPRPYEVVLTKVQEINLECVFFPSLGPFKYEHNPLDLSTASSISNSRKITKFLQELW